MTTANYLIHIDDVATLPPLEELSPEQEALEKPWPAYEWPDEPVRVAAPSRRELRKLRGLIFAGTLCVIALMVWLLSPARVGDPALYIGLTAAVLLRAVCRLFEWYNYWAIKIPPVEKPKRAWNVDVLTTACPGEPHAMIVRTLKAMTEIHYPHTNYLCDEGNDPYLRQVCEDLGVVHVTRREKKDAKAGNINNALRQATGEIALVLDPDHEPSPYMLDRTLGYFENPDIGFVQSVQGYRNQGESFIAKAAAEQSYHFYGPNMMGMNGRGTTQAIGANCVFRRSALDSIGGHAAGLAEDMHTSMRLYSKGWKSVYVPEILTRGLVPSTLPAFYKQQIKWSCGVFDLLFQEYPQLYRGFTFSQKIHFLLCPIFFLRGLMGMLEMLVPLACLTYGFIAWRATVPQIACWFIPVLGFSALIHVRVQRWLMEPGERGFHVAGGLLAIATWWVYLAGFFCALFRIKVPYIPTPKEGEPTNAVGIAIPNVIMAGILTTAAVWGVYLDSSPTALFMAGIALLNAFAMIYVSIAAQQLTIRTLQNGFASLRPFFAPVDLIRRAVMGAYFGVLNLIREGHVVPTLLLIAIFGTYFGLGGHVPRFAHARDIRANEQNVGGFYTGIDLGNVPENEAVDRAAGVQSQLGYQFRIVCFDQPCGSKSVFPKQTLEQLRRNGAIPMLNWLPTPDAAIAATQPDAAEATTKPIAGAATQTTVPQGILRQIRFNKFDAAITQFAHETRLFGEPVFICFAPQQDNPAMPWSAANGNADVDFIEAFKHIAVIFREEGATNVTWVWTPANAMNMTSEVPKELEYANWIGVPASNEIAGTFKDQYQAVRDKIAKWHLPVMIDALGATGNPQGAAWMHDAMSDITTRFPEVKAVVFNGPATTSDSSELAVIRDGLHEREYADGAARSNPADLPLWFDLHPDREPSKCLAGSPGKYSLVVDGAPFYVKGVVYNAGHDWRDADLPLSRRELNDAFSKIHAMGGNTIRRYGSNWSDRNIFNCAKDNGLKVMYGFVLPQDVDYVTDEKAMQEAADQIESTVKSYHTHPGLLGWCVGNEVWGLLKHKYSQPYLTQVRHAEVLFVEKMTKRIKELDPDHPVFCAQESFDISGAISDYAVGAPSVDVMCVNSYYEQEIAHLDLAVTHVDMDRPYLVSEFGPDGYWDDKYNLRDKQSGLLESTGIFKGWLYADRWREYIEKNKGRDVGGIAYCWSDRYEGTSTWFGMNDLDGNSKPACAALASAWHNSDPNLYGSFDFLGPKILTVDYPTQPVQPNHPFTVTAKLQTVNGDKTGIIWTVSGPDFANDVATIEPSENGLSAAIQLPDQPGWYRVQAKAINRDGLDEISVPVKVESAASVK